MKYTVTLVLICIFSQFCFAQTSETNQVIVHLKTNISNRSNNNPAVESISKKYKGDVFEDQANKPFLVIEANEGQTVEELINELQTNEAVLLAEPNYIHVGAGAMSYVPNDAHYKKQWSLKNDGTGNPNLFTAKAGADIKMESAWDIEKGSSNVIVAVIDTGCMLNHPDLEGRIWTNSNEISGNGIDDDNNGFIDDINGWDFTNKDNNPTDDNGHGTSVTGVIAANVNNTIGYAGIDMNCKIMVLKALNNKNSGSTVDITNAINYAVKNGARIINISIGGVTSKIYQTTIKNAIDNNVTIVAAMMNNNNEIVNYPAGYPDVIAVGATDPDDKRSAPFFWSATSGSCYGNHISVVAPGNYIFTINNASPDTYNAYWGGTSQATPCVAGLASLLLAQNPNLTPQEIKNIIENSADDEVGNPSEDVQGFDKYHGHGRINAFKALSMNLSTEELSFLNNPKIKIYPNPASETLNIDVTNGQKLPTVVEFYNTLGAKVLEKHISDLQNNFDINLNQGLYFVKIDTTTLKLVVK